MMQRRSFAQKPNRLLLVISKPCANPSSTTLQISP